MFSDSAKYFLSFILGIIIAILIAFSLIEFNFNNNFLLIFAGFLGFYSFYIAGHIWFISIIDSWCYQEIISGIKNLDILALLPFIVGMLLAFLLFQPK